MNLIIKKKTHTCFLSRWQYENSLGLSPHEAESILYLLFNVNDSKELWCRFTFSSLYAGLQQTFHVLRHPTFYQSLMFHEVQGYMQGVTERHYWLETCGAFHA